MTGSHQPRSLNGQRLLLCVSGGIAAYKSLELVRRLCGAGAQVQVAMTAMRSSLSRHLVSRHCLANRPVPRCGMVTLNRRWGILSWRVGPSVF